MFHEPFFSFETANTDVAMCDTQSGFWMDYRVNQDRNRDYILLVLDVTVSEEQKGCMCITTTIEIRKVTCEI